MKLQPLILSLFTFCFLCSSARSLSGRPDRLLHSSKREVLQDIVTWDRYSIFVHGKRVLFYSGEFHPFRLPVPGLWLDIFQKIRALGYTGVSFYTNWALLEGKPGNFSAEGIFALEPFFEAATRAGIYLLARPGPYINAEVSGGGFPGWLQRTSEPLRTPSYIKYTENYVRQISAIISKAQITSGGPIILLQPENEYSQAAPGIPFPNLAYFQAVEDQYRQAGIVVPFISNDARPQGVDAPGNGTIGNVDIYGHDNYPQLFDCANPYVWVDGTLPTNFHSLHLKQSPNTPYSLVEFQGGSFDPWGGPGFEMCETLTNEQFERVFYKNDFSFGVSIFNIYMTYGGTNWGNLGYALGYTSYDYGAAISEDRTVSREKYSEAKLEANFLMTSPAYLTATPGNASNGSFVNTKAIAVTSLQGNMTSFYVVRHAAYNSNASTTYRLSVSTSVGSLSIPQLSSHLTLHGRDSKIHVTDYDVGSTNLLYSTAEIFTWKQYASKKVLVLYGDTGETHEMAFTTSGNVSILECVKSSSGTSVVANTTAAAGENMSAGAPQIRTLGGSVAINWVVSSQRTVLRLGTDFLIYLLHRREAYDFWTLDIADQPETPYADSKTSTLVLKGGYLLRSASMTGDTLIVEGDFNTTSQFELVGVPSIVTKLQVNNLSVPILKNSYGVLVGTVTYIAPQVSLPDLAKLDWKYLDSLPEIQAGYDDHLWTAADKATTLNPRNLTIPTSLYGSDYGFNAGTLVFRGHFQAMGVETSLMLQTQGGTAFGHSVWLNDKFVGSWLGISINDNYNQTLSLPPCTAGQAYVLTIVLDTMGFEEENGVGNGTMKHPRGILQYGLSGRDPADVTWKITGNLGGENFQDRSRGPLNEGGTYAERQGYHLPAPPDSQWPSRSPMEGLSSTDIGLFTTSFYLDMPHGYDIPLAFVFANSTSTPTSSGLASPYRVQLFVNGFQFGKYVNNIGPQTSFPVPEGILDYHGKNYIALTLWALDGQGARLEGLQLSPTATIQSNYGPVAMAPMSSYEPRAGAY